MSKVNLTKQTIEVLKNFSTINSSILIREGNVLKTISVGENLISEFKCEESFPQTFGIYDLIELLSGLNLFKNPVLTFENNSYMIISSEGRSLRYYFSDPEITLKAAPEKGITFPGSDIEFFITWEDILSLQKASSVYALNNLVFCSDASGAVTLKLCDRENETGNVYTQNFSGTSTGEHDLYVNMENIRLYRGDYRVKVSSKLISEWQHNDLDLKYYIALEP